MAESIIKQTNRTLLIEEINPEKLNLLTLVGDVRGLDSLSDDKIKESMRHCWLETLKSF